MQTIKITICLCLFLVGSFGINAQQLKPYESFLHFDVEKYALQYSRDFDENGIIIQKKEYHALTISVYGIMNYDAFIETGDSIYYNRVVNQFKYFQDSTKLVYSDDNLSVGLPYNFDFHGMKAPWFSGMTQGTAVSFLLRYYDLSKDEYALNLSKQLIHLMLKLEADGGTIGRTKEGGMWIEEYPNCKTSKSVLNGFMNGLIGLNEYCSFDPTNVKAKTILDSCYTEMIENISQYDTPNWTTYSRNAGGISNSYLRYELEEFDHLYTLYKDERLRDQMKIWSKFAVNKLDKEIQFLKKPTYQFATQLFGDLKNDTCIFDRYELFSTGLVAMKSTSNKKGVLNYELVDDRYYCEIDLLSDKIDANKLKIVAYQKGKEVDLSIFRSRKLIIIQSSKPFDVLKVILPKKSAVESSSIVLKSYDHKTCVLPQFGFYIIDQKEKLVKNQTYLFKCESTYLTNATVFYRYAKVGEDIDTKKFSIDQSLKLDGGYFAAPEDGQYEFFISYDLEHPFSQISGLKLVQF